MMNTRMPLLITALSLSFTATALADGLFYQLPADGASVVFDAKVKMSQGGQTRDATGQLSMASVGNATEAGKPCRWLEFKLTMQVNGNERVIVAKILIPEDQLKEGKKPVENRVRGWVRMRAEGEVMVLAENNLGPIPAFLSNPLSDVKKLDAAKIQSALGELSCAGLQGRTSFKEGTATNNVEFETRRHEKAPFGVVRSHMTIAVERNGAVTNSLEMTLLLSESGASAKSELPDHN